MTPYDQTPEALRTELAEAGLDPRAIYDAIIAALEEDLPGGSEDVTSAATIPADDRGTADFGAREKGVVAGLGIAELVFRIVLGDDVTVEGRLPDGTHVEPGTVVMTVSGPTRGLLTAERTALNFASHLSGVATAAAAWAEALEGTSAQASSTRARPCRAGAPSRSTPSAAAVASTTGSACPTWRWSRTTTWSRQAAWCPRSRPFGRPTRTSPSRSR